MAKRVFALLLCLLLLGSMLPISSRAAGFIDTEEAPSLTISAQKNDTRLIGALFDLYLIATVDQYGEFTVTEDFSQFDIDIRGKNDEAWQKMVLTLESWIPVSGLEPADSGITDEDGLLTFPTGDAELPQGLYLVVGHVHTQDGMVYTPSSFLVSLPSRGAMDDEWDYRVTVLPKFESYPEEVTTITRKVLKVWKDTGYENKRPQEITVYLLKDGKIVDTVVLSAANGWSHTWEGLEPNAKWAVAENAMKDYAVEITREGITFVITNKYASGPPPSTTPGGGGLPQTGQLWWPVPVLFALGLAFVVLGLARRRGSGYED